ncbi:MAG: polymer-forming cytoskeletal protein [Bdellovibrionota bacterium]
MNLRDSAAGSKRTASSAALSDSVIAAGCAIRGDLEMKGRAQVNCRVDGEIVSDDELIVGEEGDINGNIFGKAVIIFGRVVGDIKCDERLELHAGAHVTGNVLSPRVVIQDGVVFDGRCWMGEEQLVSNQS